MAWSGRDEKVPLARSGWFRALRGARRAARAARSRRRAFGQGGGRADSGKPPLFAGVARIPIDEARRALERAAGARSARDVHHAELLEGLAREWAETARDVLRAAAVEADAGALELAAADAGVRAERARALLEESMA